MTILGLSDWIDPLIYSEKMKYRMKDVDLIISCGDVNSNYLDFVMSELNKPLLYVVGNHVNHEDYEKDFSGKFLLHIPRCFKNLHLKMYNIDGVLITGFQGSNWYNGGPFQYRQFEVFFKLITLLPKLIFNRIVYGRFLDIFVTHAPPYGVGDKKDQCHRGLKAFNLFIKLFSPQLHLHGHVHIYDINKNREKIYSKTKVINCSGFFKTNLMIKKKVKIRKNR